MFLRREKNVAVVWLFVTFCILNVLVIPLNADKDPGFDLLYTTNLEEIEHIPIQFSPQRPSWLEGTLIRNVPARYELGNRKFTNVFDPYAKLYSWSFYAGNRSEFSTKFIQTLFYNDSLAQQTIAPYMLTGTVVPGYNELQKLEQLMHGEENVNVNVNCIRGENDTEAFVALTDAWVMYQFDPKDLRTLKRIDAKLGGKNASPMMSAHILPEKGTTNFFTVHEVVSVMPFSHSNVSLVRIKSSQEREVLVDIPVKKVPYIHSFGVTENFVVIFAAPFYLNFKKLLETAEAVDALEYYPEKDTDIYVINIKTKEVIALTTPNFFFVHHVNAFENGKDELVVDICTYKNADFFRNYSVNVMKNATERNKIKAAAQLKRYVISLSSKTVAPYVFPQTKGAEFANLFDFPAINEKYRSTTYCFAYGMTAKTNNESLSAQAIVKKNLCKSGEDKFWQQEYHYPSEPWFVGRPNATEEDDGVLLVQVLDGPKGQTYLAIIDAKQMKMISSAYMPFAIPASIHGRFFSSVFPDYFDYSV